MQTHAVQVGRFRRPVLDFTAASVRFDLGLTSLHETGAVAGRLSDANAAGRDTGSGSLLAGGSLKHRSAAVLEHSVTRACGSIQAGVSGVLLQIK